MLIVKNTKTQMPVEMKPSYTAGSLIDQPRCVIERRHSVDLVSGKNKAMYFRPGYMPSMGQMMPHNMTIGKKLPMAIYVAVRSFSQADETTNPANGIRFISTDSMHHAFA